jgi:hypothetical protein
MHRILILLLIGLFSGCDRTADSARSTPADAPAAQHSEPGTPVRKTPDAAPRPTEADPQDLTAALAELTQALRKYSFEHQRLPKSLTDVIAAGYVKNMPQAPPGKKFEIDPKTIQVVLVKQ